MGPPEEPVTSPRLDRGWSVASLVLSEVFIGRAVGEGRTRVRKLLMLFAVLTLGFVASGCSDNAATPSATPSSSGADEATVDVTEKDFAIAVTPGTASTGAVKFKITNTGPSTHEFVVFKTDLD